MGRKGPKFGRKHTLQLESPGTKQQTFGLGYQPSDGNNTEGGGDGGLPTSGGGFSMLASYGDSDTDDEEQEEEPKLPKRDKIVAFQKQSFVKADTLEPEKKSTEDVPPPTQNNDKDEDDGDKSEDEMKLKAFLSEIDALDSENNSPAPQSIPASEDNEDDKEETPPKKPEEPTTNWQHCYDDSTQHYYYWNTGSNEVTWDIPSDYSQYLLKVNEYEVQMAKYKREYEAWEERHKAWKERMSKKRESTTPEVQEENEVPVPNKPILQTNEEQIPPVETESPVETNEEPDKMETTEAAEPELDEVDRVLEEAVEATYKLKKDEVQKPDMEQDTTMDMDEIEQELDSALEKKKMELQAELQEEEKKLPSKRKASALPNVPNKKPKQDDFVVHEDIVERPTKLDISNKVADMEKLVDLSDLLIDKLQFIGANISVLSRPQVLMIEIQTRLSDWRAGALSTSHFLSRLQWAHDQLNLYETQEAAPNGWTCHWHREYKRYFYTNDVTGDSQWDYPENDPDLNNMDELLKQPPPPPPSAAMEEPRVISVKDTTTTKTEICKKEQKIQSENNKHDTNRTVFKNYISNNDKNSNEQIKPYRKEEQIVNDKQKRIGSLVAYQSEEEEEGEISSDDRNTMVESTAVKPPVIQTSIKKSPPKVISPHSQAKLPIHAFSLVPPPPPPPPEEEKIMPKVNYADLASAPPPPPPPPAELEPGELADGEDDNETDKHIKEEDIKPDIRIKEEKDTNDQNNTDDGNSVVISAPPDIKLEPVTPIKSEEPVKQIKEEETEQHISNGDKTSEAHTSHDEIRKKKKKKKDKGLLSDKLSMKKKRVPSLVKKWQDVQKEVNAPKHNTE